MHRYMSVGSEVSVRRDRGWEMVESMTKGVVVVVVRVGIGVLEVVLVVVE
jgi:hypothetical protein